MAFLVVVLIVAAAMWLMVVTDPDRRSATDSAPQAADRPAEPAASSSVATRRCEIEAILVQQRVTGLLKPVDYQRAMAELAARDADRNPIQPPPDRIG